MVLVLLIPATPLNNAYLGGLFVFTKKYLTSKHYQPKSITEELKKFASGVQCNSAPSSLRNELSWNFRWFKLRVKLFFQ